MFAGGSTYSGLSASTSSSGANTGNSGAGSASSASAGTSGSTAGTGGAHHAASSGAFPNALAEANDLDALVFEYGTAKCKFGFAGEDFPRVYESPLPLDQQHDTHRAARMESDYDAIAQWLFDAASTRLQTRLSDHPLLLVERPFALPDEFLSDPSTTTESANDLKHPTASDTTKPTAASGKKRDGKARERMVEVLMETMDVPALFCAKSAVLACYANARTSGLVVEMGATYTSITSVHEGYAFAYPKSQVLLYGGFDLDAFLRAKLEPQLASLSVSTHSSRFYWSLATEAKESGLCRVADGPFDETANAQLPKIGYELPDKTIVQLGTERFSVGEQFFTPRVSATGGSDTDVEMVTEYKRGLALPELVCETGAMTTEAELRKELFQNIVLTGGSSSFENLPTRLEREVIVALSSMGTGGNGSVSTSGSGFAMAPGFGSTRVKLVAAHAQERRVGSFLGGSILASLGSFHEMWLSKAEYAEHGAALIHKKCP